MQEGARTHSAPPQLRPWTDGRADREKVIWGGYFAPLCKHVFKLYLYLFFELQLEPRVEELGARDGVAPAVFSPWVGRLDLDRYYNEYNR